MKTITFLALITALFAFSACNTVKGLGEDLEAAGRAMQDSAEDE